MTNLTWYNKHMNKSNYILFLDDERYPAFDGGTRLLVIARCFEEFKIAVVTMGIPSEIHFDHDLGSGPSGYSCVRWLQDYMTINELEFPEGFRYFIHSQNPIGARNIDQAMQHLIRNLPLMQEAYHQ